MFPRARFRILAATLRSRDSEGGEQLLNPLAIGVTLGGLLLDVLIPRPKPRVGCAAELSLLSTRAGVRTPYGIEVDWEYEGQPVASGSGAGRG
jgi:hypothetical protein